MMDAAIFDKDGTLLDFDESWGPVNRAVGLMALSTVLFGLMAVCIRLASQQLHAFEIAFFRNLFGFLVLLPILFRHGPSLLRTNKLGFYVVRCLVGMVSMLAGFWAIVNLPLAQAIALSYSTPLFVSHMEEQFCIHQLMGLY